MVVCGQQYGLKALRQAHLQRFWSIGTKTYSTKQVSIIAACLQELRCASCIDSHNLKIAPIRSRINYFRGQPYQYNERFGSIFI